MQQIIYFCDRCGTTVEDEGKLKAIFFNTTEPTKQICPKCVESYNQWFKEL